MAIVVKINDRIKNRQIRFFNEVKIVSSYDRAGSSFQINYHFNPDNPEHKEFSCIGHYHLITIDDVFKGNSDRLLTGYILSNGHDDGPEDTLSALSGYSLAGALEDCQVPPGISLETDGIPLKEIVENFVKPFGVKYVIKNNAIALMAETINDAKISPSQTVMSHFVELCSQKGIIISNDEFGRLVFDYPVRTKSIHHFKRGDVGVIRMKSQFNGQDMHSKIWAMSQQEDDEENVAESFVDNTFIPIREQNLFRPRVVVQTAGTDVDTKRVAQNALQQELKNFKVTVIINSWRIDGKIVKPGQVISVTNPKIYLYRKTDFIIDTVEYSANETEQIAVLNCVPPEVYFGGVPINPFEGINLH